MISIIDHKRQHFLPYGNAPTYNNHIISLWSMQQECQYVLAYIDINNYDDREIAWPSNATNVHFVKTVHSKIHSVPLHLILYENTIQNNRLFIDTDIIGDQSLASEISALKLSCEYLFVADADEIIDTHKTSTVNFNHCFGVGIISNIPKHTPWPIGMRCKSERDYMHVLKNLYIQPAVKTNYVYVNFQPHTHPDRPNIMALCKKLFGDHNHRIISEHDYILELKQHMFVVSPESSGCDSSRTWEALYCQTIPIVKRSVLIDYYSKIFPMIVLDDWAELSQHTFDFNLYKQIMDKFPNYQHYLNCNNLINYVINNH